MSVYERNGVWWFDFTINKRRYRGSTHQTEKRRAKAVEADERERAKLGRLSRSVPSLGTIADQWFSARMAGRKSAHDTAVRLETVLRYIPAHTPIDRINSAMIAAAIAERRLQPTPRGTAPANATVNRDMVDSTLRPILSYARKVLEIPGLPAINWAALRMQEPKGRSRTFTAAEIAAWRAALPESYRPLFDFLARYGTRLGEAFFPPTAFDAESGIIMVRQRKNGLTHEIMLLPDDAREMSARLGRAREAGLSTVWFRETRFGLEAIKPNAFEHASRKALDAAGIADARCAHDLRHHAITAFLRLPGAHMKAAQRFAGHENIVSTARYAHVNPQEVRDILAGTRHATVTDDGKDAASG